MLRRRRFLKAADKAFLGSADTADKTPMDGETFESVRRAIQALPAKYREPVVLRYLQELGTDQISRVLGISKNSFDGENITEK